MSRIWSADPAVIPAGCLIGAWPPVALTTRGAPLEEKHTSLPPYSPLGTGAEADPPVAYPRRHPLGHRTGPEEKGGRS